jgi:hypothetical protein
MFKLQHSTALAHAPSLLAELFLLNWLVRFD